MQLLCDEMLKGLSRWLRAAGHDTEIATDGESDRALIVRAKASGRLLLTRDRKLLEHRAAQQSVCLLDCNTLDDCAQAMSATIGIDWLYKPFSLCLICNTPLLPLKSDSKPSVPDDVKYGPLLHCPQCGRVYWEGGHVKRMRKKLQQWAQKADSNNTSG